MDEEITLDELKEMERDAGIADAWDALGGCEQSGCPAYDPILDLCLDSYSPNWVPMDCRLTKAIRESRVDVQGGVIRW